VAVVHSSAVDRCSRCFASISRFHDLRHTCAALLIAAGRHPLEIKTRLGHASITTTMDRYGQLFPSAEAALADALDATYDADNVIPLAREDAAAA
jgi:integrase